MTDDPTKKLPSEADLRVYLDGKIGVMIGAIQSLNANFQSLSTDFQSLSADFQSLRADFQSLRADFQELKVRVEAVEKTVIERSMETKPIWERALSEIANLRVELAETKQELRTEMKEGFRKLAMKIELLNEASLEVRSDQRLLEKRVETLESKNP